MYLLDTTKRVLEVLEVLFGLPSNHKYTTQGSDRSKELQSGYGMAILEHRH